MRITEQNIDTWLEANESILFTGKPGSGKTTLLRKILEMGSKKGIFMLPTFCDGDFPMEDQQKTLVLMLGFAVKELRDRKAAIAPIEPMIVLVDEWLRFNTPIAVEAVTELLTQGKTYGICVYMTSQSPAVGLPTTATDNIRNVWVSSVSFSSRKPEEDREVAHV